MAQSLLSKIYTKFYSLCLYPFQFKHFGKKSKIIAPLRIDGKKNIYIGDHVYIQEKTWLACESLTGEKNPLLKIGNHTTIGNFNHIYATKSISIEDYVLTADKVYISDNLHSYDDINEPIIKQPIKQISSVVIGEGSWIGENACILGVKIGKHCVIGANSVVTHDIPEYSVAVGAPAKVIKRYNLQSQKWEVI
jgi:acetyltransferase-like isoleucine patch superfamily enzyme